MGRRRNPYRMKFVNSMTNLCHMVGFVRNPTSTGYIIQQTNNIEQGIPVRIPAGHRPPAEGTMIDATCHIFGERINGEPNCVLSVIATEAPSVRHGLTMTAWRSGGTKGNDDFQPFLSTGKLRKEIEAGLARGDKHSETDKMMLELLAASGNQLDSGLGVSGNKVLIAGFVEMKRFVEPNPHQSHGYGEIYLRQHHDLERLIPIRIYNEDVRSILNKTTRLLPVYVEGTIRMKVLPDEQGNVRHKSLHIRCEDLHAGLRDKHILQVPDWWRTEQQALVAERAARQAAAAKLEEARKKALASQLVPVDDAPLVVN